MVNKTIIKEAKGKVLVRADFQVFTDVQVFSHEFWSSKKAFLESQQEETFDTEQQTSNSKVRVVNEMTDDEAIQKFNELLGLDD
ncbi:hypothetical protein [Paenibacillus sp. USHLN196]|uniref:hypothetical protein n=1 Tax=Paenibacillus sp. USHLN196 TaxID=3081291 RepID=UPI0030178E08